MSKIRYSKRPTKKLREVVDSDLLTATERIIMGTLGGYYCMADEEAYFKTSGDKSNMSVAEFERKLRKELHPNFFIAYNPKISKDHLVEGHQIGFYVPEYKGFVPLCKVGRSGQKEIPANSQGKMVKTKDKNQYGENEVAVVWRGWVAAFEAAKLFIQNAQIEGIKPQRCIEAKDFFLYKRMAQEIGGQHKLHEAFEQGRKLAEQQEKEEALKVAVQKAEEEKLTDAAGDYVAKILLDANGKEIKTEIKPEETGEDKDA